MNLNLKQIAWKQLPWTWIAAGFFAFVVFLIIVGFVWQAAHNRHAAAEGRAGQIAGDARADAASEAIGIVTDTAAEERKIDEQTRENGEAIDRAQGSRDRVSPAVADAGRRALCVRDAYRCEPACVKLLGSCSR